MFLNPRCVFANLNPQVEFTLLQTWFTLQYAF